MGADHGRVLKGHSRTLAHSTVTSLGESERVTNPFVSRPLESPCARSVRLGILAQSSLLVAGLVVCWVTVPT